MLLFNFFSLFSCAKPCDFDQYPTVTTSQDLLQACNIEDDFPEHEPCLEGFDKVDSFDQRIELYKKCSLQDFGTPQAFALSAGDHYQAALTYLWFKSKELDKPLEHAQLYLTPSLFAETTFLRINSVTSSVATPQHVQLLNQNITSEGGYGRFPDWHIPMDIEHPLVLSSDISMKTLRYVVASVASESKPIQLIFLGKDLVSIPIFAPSKAEREIFKKDASLSTEKRVRINPDDNTTIAELIPTLEQLDGKDIELAINHRPCLTPADGMECIQIDNTPVYIDTQATSKDIVQQCKDKKMCTSKKFTWKWAAQLCQFQGKRLPRLEEYQAANIEGQYWSWTRDPDSLPKTKKCADGIPYCNGKNIFLLSDGTKKQIDKTVATLPYCESDNHILSDNDPYFFTDPFPTPPPLTKDLELAKIANSVQHDLLEEKGICGMDIRQFWKEGLKNGGRSSTQCRDPYSYIASNEPWRYVWGHHLKNLGGGYVGVGSDQGYDFISSARSEWAWIYDYDPNIYRLHKLLRAVILASETPEDFVAYFTRDKRKELEQVVSTEYSVEESKEYMSLYYAYSKKMLRTYTKELKSYPIKEFGWLAVQDNYDYIRTMYQQDRLVIVKGDLMGKNAFRSISSSAQQMEVPIRIFYVSNAPLAWGGRITPGYRANVEALLPAFDENSVFIAAHGGGAQKLHERGRWLYITANARLIGQRISQHYYSNHLMWDKEKSVEQDLNTVGIPNKRRNIVEITLPTIPSNPENDTQ